MQNKALILFTKEPLVGQVKTRLIPCLGKQGAYHLYTELINTMLNRFANTTYADFIIYKSVANIDKSYFDDYPKVREQQGADLGSKMYHALFQELSHFDKVILFGADCPFLTKAIIQTAFLSLETHDYVFVPSVDGGYVLIGAKTISKKVFQNINWSSAKVMLQTCQILDKMNASYQLLEPLVDIDTPGDLEYLN